MTRRCVLVPKVTVVGKALNGTRDSLDAAEDGIDAGLDALCDEAMLLNPRPEQGTVPRGLPSCARPTAQRPIQLG
jgi:hypothetical protein